jgi:hypothetical protein
MPAVSIVDASPLRRELLLSVEEVVVRRFTEAEKA